MNKKELISALNELPDDVIILYQVVGEESGGWSMEAKLSGVLPHFKWDKPVAALTLSHPNLKALDPVTWDYDETSPDVRKD